MTEHQVWLSCAEADVIVDALYAVADPPSLALAGVLEAECDVVHGRLVRERVAARRARSAGREAGS